LVSSFLGRGVLLTVFAALYLLSLGGTGFVAADEPRYAALGRSMAETGDLITPRLDGAPWFEKPPLLYWTTAAATRFGFRDEWAARLPGALISLAFLWFFWGVLEREFSRETALLATSILGLSIGWVAYSFVAVTDLEMSALLGVALLVTLFDTRPGRGWVAGLFLGLAVLAKAFVPLVLFFPAWTVARGKRIQIPVAAALVAAPWHLLCYRANGSAWWDVYFWKQMVARFFDAGLEHVQPIWFYLPVLLGLMFPWTPLMALLMARRTWADVRIQFLGWWVLFGFAVFSVSRNKLPGYVLPLMPALAVILAEGLRKASRSQWLLASSAAMLALLPPAAARLPAGLLVGIRRAQGNWTGTLVWSIPFVLAAGAVWWLAHVEKRREAALVCALAAAAGFAVVKWTVFPVVDRSVSARAFWMEHKNRMDDACLEENLRRDWEYGLNYYAHRALPHCEGSPGGVRVGMSDGKLALR
jgi:4-amino-4-deoxy-L-arabinose transferase-like glycosyltransferase